MTFDFPPIGNPHMSGLCTAQLFSPGECDEILRMVDTTQWRPGTVTTRSDLPDQSSDRAKARKAESQPFVSNFSEFPMRRVVTAVKQINDEYFRFAVSGFLSEDRPQFVRYRSEDSALYEAHTDLSRQSSTRKLSFVVQLTEPSQYEGGNLVFPAELKQASRELGSITAFPSFLLHEVTPVTRGTRVALVGWIHGPAFQ